MAFFDLCTLAQVNGWLIGGAAADAALIQSAITGYSKYILKRTGRNYLGGFRTYTERYDGNGSDFLPLRNYPVLSITSLTIGTDTIPQSADFVQPGWAVDISGSQAAVVLIGGSHDSAFGGQSPWYQAGPRLGGRQFRFWEGRQNIGITYVAGTLLDEFGESHTVPAVSPFLVVASNAPSWYADGGVMNAAGASLAGQYTVSGGEYTFEPALAGQEVVLSYQYGGVPEDLSQAVSEIVATNYKRRGWIDQASQIQPGVGTTAFRSWEMSPQNAAIINTYRATFLA